ncbi:MAG: hypothetical protein GC165_18775 [Armatimonadetes bacterium]|nr:hypothetical protein [Armatimonadota bacterium]MBS1726447.1 DUF5615 family PIN-like protein [Armatimonadota bacterium]
MRILLDENMPLDFGDLLPGHIVDHLELIGHKGTNNGKLLALAREQYDALLTLDKGILHQHRHEGPLIILAIRVPNSSQDMIRQRSGAVLRALAQASAGTRGEVPYHD